jgi:hypothetical protein
VRQETFDAAKAITEAWQKGGVSSETWLKEMQGLEKDLAPDEGWSFIDLMGWKYRVYVPQLSFKSFAVWDQVMDDYIFHWTTQGHWVVVRELQEGKWVEVDRFPPVEIKI